MMGISLLFNTVLYFRPIYWAEIFICSKFHCASVSVPSQLCEYPEDGQVFCPKYWSEIKSCVEQKGDGQFKTCLMLQAIFDQLPLTLLPENHIAKNRS